MSQVQLEPRLARAIRRQVRRTPRFDRYARKNYGIPGVTLLGRVSAGEGGGRWDPGVSSAGARKGFQFIRSTRDAYKAKYGVDAWKDPDSAAKAAIIHIMSTGLKGYNPGDPNYSHYILSQRLTPQSRRILKKGGGSVGGGGQLSIGRRAKVVGEAAHMDTKGFLLDYLRDERKNKSLASSYLHARQTGEYDVPSTLRIQHGKLNRQPRYNLPAHGVGKLVGHPLDRAGAPTSKQVLNFARQVSQVFGRPITLGTGTQHSRMTVNGNVSDHWDGHALDLPATGRRLILMGQAALIAAGMSPRKARQQTGGLFNVGGHQIIFNTQEGGDHTTHLHISG